MRFRERFFQALPLLLLLIYTWFRAGYQLASVTDPDPGLFESFAYHILNGKVLYADIWDHKPPLIFYLNLGFEKLLGDSENAVSYGVLMFCLLQTAVFYFLLIQIFRNKFTAFLGTILFITVYYSLVPFGSGNYTEQYGVLFTSAGLLFLLKFIESRRESFLWISGIFYGLAWWFKEPFLLSAVPVVIYMLIICLAGKIPFRHVVYFCIAFIVPGFLLCDVMALTGSWNGFKEQVAHNSNYAIYSQKNVPLWIRERDNMYGFLAAFPFSRWVMLPIIFAGSVFLILHKKTRVAGTLILAQQLADYFATGMSGNRFHHYYLQTIPLTLLLIFSLAAMPAILLKQKNFALKFIPGILICGILISFQKPWNFLALSPDKKYSDPIAEYLRNHEYYEPRFIAMGSKDIGFYLFRAKGVSEQRYIVPYAYHWIPMKGKPNHHRMLEDSANFTSNPPDYVIRSENWAEMFEDCKLDSFVESNYFEAARNEMPNGAKAFLLRRNPNFGQSQE